MEAYEESTMGHALQKNYSFDDLWATAIHEAGHLICVMKSPDNLYTYDFISIVPRSGGSLGVTYYIPKNEEISTYNKKNLFSKIIASLGGMVAEQFFLQVTGSGVSDDLEKATYIAKQMVFKLGMNDSLVVLEEDSKEGLEKVDKVLKEAKEAADKIISENEKEILIIANALMERKTLTREEIDELLKKN
jgi:ATP-dependent Zn protease